MSDPLDRRLHQLGNELADQAPPPHGWATVEARAEDDAVPTRSDTDRSRWWAAIGAALIVGVGLGALITTGLVDRGGDDDAAPGGSFPPPSAGSVTPTAPTTTVPPLPGVIVDYDVLVEGELAGGTDVTGFAASEQELAALWATVGLDDPVPEVDFDEQVVVYFGLQGGGCQLQPLEALRYSASTQWLFPVAPRAGGDGACPEPSFPHAIVVAVDRQTLPPAPFNISVDENVPPDCDGCWDGITTVTPDMLTPAATTTTSPAPGAPEVTEANVVVPTGSLDVNEQDLIVLHDDGDLWLHPSLLGPNPGTPVRILDFPDPGGPVEEGPGPRVVEEVAGVVGGALLFSDCCEPAVGNLLALPAVEAEAVSWGYGAMPSLSPDRSRLVATSVDGVTVTEPGADVARSRSLSSGDTYVTVRDVGWSPTSEAIVAVVLDEGGYSLVALEATTLVELARLPLGITVDQNGVGDVRIAGTSPDGVVLSVIEPSGVSTLRTFDARSLVERPDLARTLPGAAGLVQVRPDATTLWVDDGELWLEAPGEQPRSLGQFSAAWFP
jgi:hypothetical protein